MYCDRCGASLQQGQKFCSGCGKAVGAQTTAGASRLQSHLRLLAILWFVVSACILLPGLFLLSFSPLLLHMFPPDVPDFIGAILPAAGIFLTAIAAVGFFAGWGLLERAPWARTLSIVLGCFSLLHMPLGTALGIYTLWVLLPARSEAEYRHACGQPSGQTSGPSSGQSSNADGAGTFSA